MKPYSVSQGWGSTNTDKSNDGNNLSIASRKYETGFGTHANGHVAFDLEGKYERLTGACGGDDEVEPSASLYFRIETNAGRDAVGLRAKISPRRDGRGIAKWDKNDPGSPWRLIIVAQKAIDLPAQTILMNVSRPSDPAIDWSWVKPGIAAWNWWSESDEAPTTETIKNFISFASEMGWEYTVVPDHWYTGKKYWVGDARNDILSGSENIDIEELVDFAKEKNVRLFLCFSWKDFERQRSEAFPLYEKWGIAGIRMNFTDADDQEINEWCESLAQEAAEHKPLLAIHGMSKPTGL